MTQQPDNTQAELREQLFKRLPNEWYYHIDIEGVPQASIHKEAVESMMTTITAYTNKQIEEVLDRLENKGLLLEHSLGATDSGRVRRITEAIEAERNKLKESTDEIRRN